MRVLHLPSTVGGHPQGLAQAERSLGVDSLSVAFFQNYFNYPADEVIFSANDNPLTRQLKLYKFFWRVIKEFDIFHFNFGQSFFPIHIPLNYRSRKLKYPRSMYRLFEFYLKLIETRDLPILKKLGKGIVVTYQGDDARQGDYLRQHFEINIASEVDENYYFAKADAAKRKRIARFALYADRIYALNPDLLHVLPTKARFMAYASINPREWVPVTTYNQKPIVLFAGTHPVAKGGRFIFAAIERLQREGIPFEFVKVENLSNIEARKIYERADLLIDQLLAGWYGGAAVELMALGKPVICYIREDDLKFIQPTMRHDLPIINATPTTIHEVLKECLTVRRHELPEIGRRGRAYVERWHDPLKIAAKLKREYEIILTSKMKNKQLLDS